MEVSMDMEFTGLHQRTTLISLALVDENGFKLYLEFMDYDTEQVDDWLTENVIKHLWDHQIPDMFIDDYSNGILEYRKCNRAAAKTYIAAWLEKYESVYFYGDCLAYDWMLFCELFGGALFIPTNIYYIPFDICTSFMEKGIDPDINREEFASLELSNASKHNALWDAMVIAACRRKLDSYF